MGSARQPTVSRRRFFALAGAGLAATALPLLPTDGWAAPRATAAKTIYLDGLYTGERLKATFWENGSFVPEVLRDIDRLMRDCHSGQQYPIDPYLLNSLHTLSQTIGPGKPIGVVCGYRSPETNAQLIQDGRVWAAQSFHLYGRAVDIRIPGVSQRDLYRAAMRFHAGGVGNYPKANFVHVDTGPHRHW